MKILELVLEAKIFENVDNATRIISEGGFSINHVKVKDPELELNSSQHILQNNFTLIRVGMSF